MKGKNGSVWLAILGLAASVLACNAPTPTPQAPSPIVTSDTPSALPPQETVPRPPGATLTSTSQAPTVTPSPTATEPPPTVRPTSTPPVSTGPLYFTKPTSLDNWQSLPDGGHRATIILHITGGAPPYTIHHDLDVFTTWKSTPAIVFTAQGCSALVHTITVKSADGQSAKHDYWIPVPWCD